MAQYIKRDDALSLINPKPLLEQADKFIEQAHSSGDVMLELFLMDVKEQVEQIEKRPCVMFFKCTCEDGPKTDYKFPDSAMVMVRIFYPSSIDPKLNKCTYVFALRCRKQAADTAKSLPLERGDVIRVVGRLRTRVWLDEKNERRWRFYVETAHIELVTKRKDKPAFKTSRAN